MKFPIFHWQEPQPHNGEGPTSAKAPHGDPSLVRTCTPEEEYPWPLAHATLHVSTATALRTPEGVPFLGGRLSDVRIGQTLFFCILFSISGK